MAGGLRKAHTHIYRSVHHTMMMQARTLRVWLELRKAHTLLLLDLKDKMAVQVHIC